jgi:hypothetical protein
MPRPRILHIGTICIPEGRTTTSLSGGVPARSAQAVLVAHAIDALTAQRTNHAGFDKMVFSLGLSRLAMRGCGAVPMVCCAMPTAEAFNNGINLRQMLVERDRLILAAPYGLAVA